MEGLRPLRNYHSHTTRCKHASGTEESYVITAIEEGFDTLGFSDHSPWPYQSDFVSRIRMDVQELPDYVRTIRALGEKYKEQIHIPLGLECEAFPEFFPWLKDIKAQYLDYVILGNHFELSDEKGGMYFGMAHTADDVRRYVKCTVDGMATGLFDYVAHADLCLAACEKLDHDMKAALTDLIQAARDMNIPLEYNLLGLRRRPEFKKRGTLGYPAEGFWELVGQIGGAKAIIGIDAHETEHVHARDLYAEAEKFLSDLNIEIVRRLDV